MNKIKIDNKPPESIDNKLLNLIIENTDLLRVISDMDVAITIKKIKKEHFDLEQIIDSSLEDQVLFEVIEKNIADEFKKLWLETSNEKIGIILEKLISYFGPFKLKCKVLGCSRESKVYDTGKDNDFDVIFYDKKSADYTNDGKYIQIESHEIEFHECKKNVCTYIPCKKELLEKGCKKKLEFIMDVHKMVDKSMFYIPTFKYDTSGPQKFLNDNGYDFIEILNIRKIINRYLDY